MLQPFPSFPYVSLLFAGQMRDDRVQRFEANAGSSLSQATRDGGTRTLCFAEAVLHMMGAQIAAQLAYFAVSSAKVSCPGLPRSEGWSGPVRPVRLFPLVVLVVDEPHRRPVPVDDLVKRELTRERADVTDVAAELLSEHLRQALDQEALPGRQRALLPIGRPFRPYQDRFQDVGRSALRLDFCQEPGGLSGAELAGGTLPAGLHVEEP